MTVAESRSYTVVGCILDWAGRVILDSRREYWTVLEGIGRC